MGGGAQHQASLQRVLTRLEHVTGREARWIGGQYQTLCPVHGDRTPSLTVKWENGATYIHCHAGCTGTRPHADPSPVLDAIGLAKRDLFDEPREPDHRGSVTDLTQRRRERAARQPVKYQVPGDLAPRTIPKAKSDKADKPEYAGRPRIECWHLYQDPESLAVTWASIRIVQDLAAGGYEKEFRYVRKDPSRHGGRIFLGEDPATGKRLFATLPDGWTSGAHKDKALNTLFHLGFLRDDVVNGRTIYVVDGESDTIAGRAAGMATTSRPKSAGHWLPSHSAELAGANVVLVVDCDDAGIKDAEEAARSLLASAASIRVVQAREGKDLRDHLAAGYGPDDLVEIDLGIPELHPDRAAAQAGEISADPDADSSSTSPTALRPNSADTATETLPGLNYIVDPNAPNEKPTYLIRRGEIVERTWRQEGRGEDAVFHARYKTVLACAGWLVEVTEEDDGQQDLRYQALTRDELLHLERFDDAGNLIDQVDVRMPTDMINSGEWAQHWPWPDTLISLRRADREKAITAIRQARPAPPRRTKVYVSTGWRDTPDGPLFIHGGGAIDRHGYREVQVDLDDVLARTALPEPSNDPELLRSAYFCGTDPLRQLPARITAPLRGMIFGSLVAPMEMVTNLHGPKGTKKTAIARVHLQHIAPGMRFSTGVKEMVSGASHMSTTKGMARMLARAKDIPLLVDDLAPDRGGAAEARTRLGELARTMYNRSVSTQGTWRPGQVATSLPPRCSLITTGEIVADGSGGSRCLNIAVEPGQITSKMIAALETREAAEARGLIGASYIQWVAERREAILSWRDNLRETYLAAWLESLQHLPYGGDIVSRIAEAARDYTVGELLFLTFLTDRQALSDAEAEEIWLWSLAGIRQAAIEIDAETSDTAVNLIGTIKELLATTRAHLTARKGGPPEFVDDPHAPLRYGWTPQQRLVGSGMPGVTDIAIQWREGGARIGAVDEKFVYLLPSETEVQARLHRQRSERAWTETTHSLGAALDNKGWITVEEPKDPNGRIHREVNRRNWGLQKRVWEIPRWLIDGDDPEDDRSPGGGPLPLSPMLLRRPGWLELPLETEPVQDDQELPQELPAAVGYDQTTTAVVTPPAGRMSLKAALQALTGGQATPARDTVVATPADTAVDTDASPAAGPSENFDSDQEGTFVSSTSTQPAPTRPETEEWSIRMAVFDTASIAYPMQDGAITQFEQSEPPTAVEIVEIADALGIGHGRAGVGHLWLTPRMSDHLGLIVDEDLTEMVAKLGLDQRKDLKDWKSKRNVAAVEQLIERAQPLVDELAAAGWYVAAKEDGRPRIGPRFTVRHPDPDDPQNKAKTRVFTLVLAAYSYMWESKEDDSSGPDVKDFPLPDPDEQPAAYAEELARRVGRIGEMLKVPWQSSAANTGAEMVARMAVHMPFDTSLCRHVSGGRHGRDCQHGQDWRTLGAEQVPALPRMPGQSMWEPHNKWFRVPLAEEIEAATELVILDERGSYLPRAISTAFGIGEPEQWEPERVVRLLAADKAVYGLADLELPTWQFASMMPPHPDMAADQVNRRYTSLRTPWLLANCHRFLSGEGFTQAELVESMHSVWVWPRTHRLYETWGTTVRTARVDAEEQVARAQERAEHATDPGERALWEQEVATWSALVVMSKNIYTGYLGKIGSLSVKNGGEPYRYHYRPLAQATIWGEQRVMAWMKIARYGTATGTFPVFAAGTDSYGYLAPTLTGEEPTPDKDDGRFGKLRAKHRLALTDSMREQLLRGEPGYRVSDMEIARLQRESGGEQA